MSNNHGNNCLQSPLVSLFAEKTMIENENKPNSEEEEEKEHNGRE